MSLGLLTSNMVGITVLWHYGNTGIGWVHLGRVCVYRSACRCQLSSRRGSRSFLAFRRGPADRKNSTIKRNTSGLPFPTITSYDVSLQQCPRGRLPKKHLLGCYSNKCAMIIQHYEQHPDTPYMSRVSPHPEFTFETNSPPVGGYLISDLLSATAGVDSVTLQSTSWTDDFDDLPVSYAFGYAHGWQDITSVAR